MFSRRLSKDVLRESREKAGLTPEQLARRAGIRLSTLRGYELGTVVPNGKTIEKLRKATGVAEAVFAQCEDVFVFLAFKIKDQLTRSESDELARTLKQLRLLAVQEFTREIQLSKKAETDLAHYALPHGALIQLPFAAKVVEKAARLVAKIRHVVENPRRTDLVIASPQMPRPASEYKAWPGPAGDECD